jgi:hypothetical protein
MNYQNIPLIVKLKLVDSPFKQDLFWFACEWDPLLIMSFTEPPLPPQTFSIFYPSDLLST